jgi:hypothetical protein
VFPLRQIVQSSKLNVSRAGKLAGKMEHADTNAAIRLAAQSPGGQLMHTEPQFEAKLSRYAP